MMRYTKGARRFIVRGPIAPAPDVMCYVECLDDIGAGFIASCGPPCHPAKHRQWAAALRRFLRVR